MKTDFTDLRFTASDGTTLLSFWTNSYTSGVSANVWVKVTDNLDTSKLIYMYYGNAGASNLSNATATFIFFDDFENNNFNRWTSAGAYWSTESSVVAYGTYSALGLGGSTSGSRCLNKTLSTIDYSFMLHMMVRFTVAASAFLYGGFTASGSGHYAYNAAYDTSSIGFGTYNAADGWKSYNIYPSINTWYSTEAAWDKSNSSFQFRYSAVWGAERAAKMYDGSAISSFTQLFSWTSNSATHNHYLDDVYIRKWLPVEPVSRVGDWVSAGVANPVFWTEQISFQGLFILFGLILIPVSTIYLTWGGKDSLDSDKGYFFLILFFVGIALFIGGITS